MTPASDAAVALLPCPFCGGEAREMRGDGYESALNGAGCTVCGAYIEGDAEDSREAANAAWNRRAPALDAAARTGVDRGCVWTLDSSPSAEIWETGCGESWSFTEGGPQDNNVRFCYGCGKPVNIAAATDGGEG